MLKSDDMKYSKLTGLLSCQLGSLRGFLCFFSSSVMLVTTVFLVLALDWRDSPEPEPSLTFSAVEGSGLFSVRGTKLKFFSFFSSCPDWLSPPAALLVEKL